MQLLKIWIPVLLAAAAFLAACTDEEFVDVYPEKEHTADGNIYIRFRMNISGIPGATRTEGTEGGDTPTTPDEPTEPNTPREEVIESILILVYDADADTLIDKIKIDNKQTIDEIRGNGTVRPIHVNKVKKLHIFAAANLTDRMERLFIVGETKENVSIAYQNSQKATSNYWDVINEIVPGTDGRQEKLESNSGTIPMTGQFKTRKTGETGSENSQYDIIVTDKNNTAKTAVSVIADVSRIVAKVHVLAQCDETLTENVTDPKTNKVVKQIKYVNSYSNYANKTGQIGWILLDDVRYIPNGTNKSTYIFSQKDDNTGNTDKPIDLNMNLESYIATTYSSDNAPKFGFNAILWANDFSFCDGLSLHKENISEKSHFSNVEQYNVTTYTNTKLDNNTDDRYTLGMYCPENYFYDPSETNKASFDNYKEAIPMVTHVYIATKLFPKWIVIESNFMDKMTIFANDYTTGKETFLKEYGVTEKDFNENDVDRWNTIKDIYFTTNNAFLHTAKNFRFVEAQSKEDAADLIKWSLIINNMYSSSPADFENGRYPEGTFFTYERDFIPSEAEAETKPDTKPVLTEEEYPLKYLYLTAGAFNNATGDISHVKTYSVPHIGGWCYYFTYLDDLETGDAKTPYTASQVTRNTYYLIEVSNFGFPGGSISRPEYIKVNTETIEWDYAGEGKITLH